MAFDFDIRTSDSPLVKRIWRTQANESGSFISPAASNWEMVVVRYEGEMFFTLRGPETQPSSAVYDVGYEFFGISFKLGTYMPHLSLQTIMNRQDKILPDTGNKRFWLNSSSWEFPSFENADTFIERLVRQGILAYEPMVDAVLQGHPTDYSPRAVQYRFLHATGMTQSAVHQIERARRAKALIIQGKPILDTVYEAGYFDQAHLTRSLKRFMGKTPTQIVEDKSLP